MCFPSGCAEYTKIIGWKKTPLCLNQLHCNVRGDFFIFKKKLCMGLQNSWPNIEFHWPWCPYLMKHCFMLFVGFLLCKYYASLIILVCIHVWMCEAPNILNILLQCVERWQIKQKAPWRMLIYSPSKSNGMRFCALFVWNIHTMQ